MQASFWRVRLLSICAALALVSWGSCQAQQQAAPAQSAPAASVTPALQSPRPFGYVLGDVLTQRIALEYEGRALEPTELPALERTGNWFTRRDARLERDAAGRSWLTLDYQVINVPDELSAVELPALDLATADPKLRIEIQAMPVTVAPITPATVLSRAGLEEMQPDAEAPRMDVLPLERNLRLTLYFSALLAIAWMVLFAIRLLRARGRLPFARARTDMRRLDDPTAIWRRLHRALDDTAGHVVRGHNLHSLLARAPWLVPMEQDLKRFFEASQERFFAGRAADGVEPLALCARAAKLERKALA
ncbi:MAG: nonribosomal peptide synthetase MxaA [Methyloversatilis sp.]|jgi:mxaA protein|nr:nonribosomal peptide synthetase MxaA [Methyloversatilis sp.]MBP6195011.1 nonribosomal peptide synthetase MxaA [Methyloversatilis sp.]